MPKPAISNMMDYQNSLEMHATTYMRFLKATYGLIITPILPLIIRIRRSWHSLVIWWVARRESAIHLKKKNEHK